MPGAIAAAVAGNYGIEVDLQISADGEAMVHHDDRLGRLAAGNGALRDLTAAALKAVAFHATPERMMTLGDLCDLVAGRVPMMIELKSRFDGDLRVAARAAAVLASYGGPVGVASFDPALVGNAAADRPAACPRDHRRAALRPRRNGTASDGCAGSSWHSSCMAWQAVRISSPTGSAI